MKKLLLLLITLSSFTISSCQEKMKKYDWIPTECAPENYPAEIYSGFLYYGNQKRIYIPNGRVVNYGWGAEGSVNIAGEDLKEAPHTLEISWLSFTERKNYSGKFELDTKQIEALFAAGFPDEVEGGKDTYHTIKVGMAPGGDVVVWLTGTRNKQVEVGHFKAQPTDKLDWKKLYPDMDGGIETYIDQVVAKLPDEVKEEIKSKKIPFDYWAGLRKRYSWKPVLTTNIPLLRLDLDYFNKERDFIFGEALKNIQVKSSGIIEHMNVYWLDDKKRQIRTEIKFEEREAFSVFSNIGEQGQGELLIQIDPAKQDAAVKLKVKDKEIPFKQLKVQNFYR